MESPNNGFATSLPIIILARPEDQPTADWQEVERGPGYMTLPTGMHFCLRVRNIDDYELRALLKEVGVRKQLVYWNLSENRKVSDAGLAYLVEQTQTTELNLSSCDLRNLGLSYLSQMPNLQKLDLSYCNRISDAGIKSLAKLTNLKWINLAGCINISHGGVSRLERRGLTIIR